MHRKTGEIVPLKDVLEKDESEQAEFVPMKVPPTPLQQVRGRVGRNEPCPCGSGRKFKKCCLIQD